MTLCYDCLSLAETTPPTILEKSKIKVKCDRCGKFQETYIMED